MLIVLRSQPPLTPYRRRITIRRQSGGGLCTFPGHVGVDQVVAPNLGGMSPLETGCTGNRCRRPRRATGGVATGGDLSPMGRGSGAASPRCATALGGTTNVARLVGVVISSVSGLLRDSAHV